MATGPVPPTNPATVGELQALAALADLAGSNRGALLVAEVGALPLCVRMLQSSDEAGLGRFGSHCEMSCDKHPVCCLSFCFIGRQNL